MPAAFHLATCSWTLLTMKPTWLTTEPCEPPFPGIVPRLIWTKTPGNITYSFMPILNHLPPMPTNIFLFASTSFEAKCQCPMVTPTSLNGNGCATASVAASVDANKRPAIKVFMQSSQLSRRSDGRVGADASTSPGGAPRRGSHVVAQNQDQMPLDIP